MEAALKSGALAGKVSGAGGGGFMMFIVDPHNRLTLERELLKRGGTILPFRFSFEGVESWTAER
jgi:D-glycero-alpha-D-manno-heptose-7-phosphate kinase